MQKAIDRSNIRNVLVRGVNWLGDAVMTTPALRAIRQSFPHARISLLATPLVAELFTPHPFLDEVLIYDRRGGHRGVSGRLRLAAELRKKHFDLAILLQDAFDAALITWLARIPRRMGNASDGRRVLLTHRYPMNLQEPTAHHVDNYLRMLGRFGISTMSKDLCLAVTEVEECSADTLLSTYGVESATPLVGINPGATYGSAKRWHPDRFAAVAEHLADAWEAKIVITGGPDEVGIAGEIEQALGGRCINMAGKTTVRQLMALIKRCNFFVTNDSGPMHIAAAFAVPLVAIFGSTDYRTTCPYSANSVVISKDAECAPCLLRECPTDHRCMTEVTADDVIAAALRVGIGAASSGAS